MQLAEGDIIIRKAQLNAILAFIEENLLTKHGLPLINTLNQCVAQTAADKESYTSKNVINE